MSKKPRIAALVPMRHHSVRVPEKNFRLIAGKPLYHYILSSLLAVPEIDQIVVDTDSEKIMEGINIYFPSIKILQRPEHLRADSMPMNEILLHDTGKIEADLYLQTHSTNPLLKPETISKAINQLLDNMPAFDSLFSVTKVQTRFWDQLTRPINHNPNILLRTQDLPPIFEENSCIYLFERRTLLEHRNRIGEKPLMFEVDRSEAFDIDEELDFLLAELMISHQTKRDLV
ncbi:MAG: acylneuraminate cytidylyltransferase family protein [Anaerolineaceae bacterium]|jgi:CMP-N-acetylneuraminic acid synthetase|nr:acylneuraminate cytidylyltransferase family protein [Anaerolineaceae bacterium]